MSAAAASVARAAAQPLLSFRAVGKSFRGGVRALDAISFDVRPGEFCVLLGRSGAGKSTLLRTVNGLTDLSSGEVIFDGRPVTPKTAVEVRRRVSMIHQQFNLVPRLSVAANVLSGALAAQPWWRSAANWYPAPLRAKAWSLIKRVGLGEEHVFRRVQDLSGGQQQRVGIARAFMLDPELILADEPVASLDPKVSRDVLTLLHSAARERGAAVLCSLHQLDLAQEFADRIVGVHGGQVVFDGKPAALTRDVVERIYEMGPREGEPAPLAFEPAPNRIDYVLGRLSRFTETVTAAGHVAETRSVEKRVVAPPARVAARLGLADGDTVVRVDTLRLLDGAPVGLSTHYLLDPQCRPALELYDEGELHEFLGRLGIELTRRDSAISVDPLEPECRERLGLRDGERGLVVESVNIDSRDARPVELAISRFRPEAIRLLVTL
jgi:phosphonate transport system ATP-binding protein